jgi:hypothetical protein
LKRAIKSLLIMSFIFIFLLTGTAYAKTKYKKPAAVYKKNQHFILSKLHINGYIADYKCTDVSGDRIKDDVILVGSKFNNNDSFFTNLNVVVRDGKTKKYIKYALDKNCCGYEPNMCFGDFNNDKIPDIFISMPTGGSGGIINSMLVSFKGNKPEALFDFNKFNNGIDLSVKFVNNFQVELNSKSLNKKEVYDLPNKDMFINSGVYDKNGVLLKTTEGWIDGFSDIKPVYNGKFYSLTGMQRICGICHAETLGSLKSFWKWDGKTMKLNPENVLYEAILYDNNDNEADIDGDGENESISMVGNKTFGDKDKTIKNIKIEVYDEKNPAFQSIPIGKVTDGYNPELEIEDVNGDKSKDLLVSLKSGEATLYSLISCKNDKVVYLFDQEQFSKGLNYKVNYKDNFQGEVFLNNKTYTLDLSSKKDLYIKDGIYKADGSLANPVDCLENGFCSLKIVNKDGGCELQGIQQITGISKEDVLGYIKSSWKVDNDKVNLLDVSVEKDISTEK